MFLRKMQILLRVHDVAEIRTRRRDGKECTRGFDLYASHGSTVSSMIYTCRDAGKWRSRGNCEEERFPRRDAVRRHRSIN